MITTPWGVPLGDEDCDGIASGQEAFMGTFPWVTCAATAIAGDEPTDPWPPDADDNQVSNIGDIIILFKDRIQIPAAYQRRSDFDADGDIDMGDVIKAGAFLMMNCGLGSPPVASWSRYMKTLDSTFLYNEGCRQADDSPDDATVILDYGQPQLEGSTYGTWLYNNTFASVSQIEEAAKNYLRGYWNCSADTPWKHVTLAIGTTNYQGSTGAITYGHGQAWAQMVNRVNDWIDLPPTYRSREEAVGANDIQPDWSTPEAAKDWANGYDSANGWRYFNYGSADGCPPVPGDCGTPRFPQWTQDDVWYISWGVQPAWPVPEIYLTDGMNAEQWHQLSVYSYNAHGARMTFLGAFTQWQACQDVGCNPATANPPAQGWRQLWVLLNADSRTPNYYMPWSTDIRQN